MQKHNFNSGPSILPATVIEQLAQGIINFNNTGLSIAEIGHRTSYFVEVIEEAKSLVKQLMQIGNEYEVLFLHGGATTQFMQVPLNLLNTGNTAAYCDNGIWGSKAIKEASLYGNIEVVASSANKKYTYINKDFSVPAQAKYLHITTNNTVEGTQWHQLPNTTVPLVADMSSDIFSRPFNYNAIDLIYAGAQKNMGAAGVSLVVIKKTLLPTLQHKIPAILDYRKHIEANSLLNTPPVIAIYTALLTLRWIIAQGGLAQMEKQNAQKASLLYNCIQNNPLFYTNIEQQDRSLMNAVFYMNNPEVEARFLQQCTQQGFVGIKGYRTMGGLRVSMYNALPLSSVQAFCDFANHFAQTQL